MFYDSLDDRPLTNSTGCKWQHSYEMYVESVSGEQHLHVGGGRYYRFVPDGAGGYVERHGPGVNAKGGKFFMEKKTVGSQTNVVVYVRRGGHYEFEPDGSGSRYRLIAVADRLSDELRLNYGTNNLITNVVTAAGNVFEFAYSGSGFLTNIHDVACNRNTRFAYTNSFLAEVADMGGQTFKYRYNSDGNVTNLLRPNLSGSFDVTTIGYSGSPSGAYTVTMTLPDGSTRSCSWGGTAGSTMDLNFGFGGLTRMTPDTTYSFGAPYVEIEDANGGITTFLYYDVADCGTNSAIVGKIKKQVDPDGTITEYMYNNYGDILTKTLRDSATDIVNVTSNAIAYFSSTNRLRQSVLTEVRDGNGALVSKQLSTYVCDDRGTSNAWDDVCMLDSVKEWYGTGADEYTERKYCYNDAFQLTATKELTAGTNTYRVILTNIYDSARGHLISAADACTDTVHYAYDARNLVTSQTWSNSLGSTRNTAYSRDNLDRMTNVLYPDGVSESWTHAPCGCGILSHVDRGGNVTSNSYSPNKWLSKVRTWSTNGTLVSYVEYKHNAAGQITNAIDALTNISASEYNSAGDLVKSTDPLGRVTEHQYDSAGRQHMTIHPDGTIFSNAYDCAGNLASSALIGGTVVNLTQYSRDALGRVITTTDALGNVASNTYDMAGRTIKVTWMPALSGVEGDQSCQETVFDLLGNVVKQIGPVPAGATQAQKDAATTSNSYDSLNRLVSTVDPEGRTTTYEYSTDWPQQVAYVRNGTNVLQQNIYHALTGFLITNISYGVLTSYEHDNLGQVTSTTFADGSSATNTYDGPRLVSQRSRTGNLMSFGFDAIGRRTSVTNSLGAVTHFAFDAVGNMTNMTDALTNRTSYVFDSMNRLTVAVRPDGSASTNTYDSLGRLASRTGAGSVPVSYRYDLLDRMTNLIDGEENSTKFSFDSMGRLSRKTYADGTFYQYSYSARGWLTNRLDATGKNTRYSYNNAGQRSQSKRCA